MVVYSASTLVVKTGGGCFSGEGLLFSFHHKAEWAALKPVKPGLVPQPQPPPGAPKSKAVLEGFQWAEQSGNCLPRSWSLHKEDLGLQMRFSLGISVFQGPVEYLELIN